MSEICEAFTCTPLEARRQDWTLVQSILDYRNAKAAIDLFNQGRKGIEELSKHEGLQRILLELHRAQDGGMTSMGEIMADMDSRSQDESEPT